MNEQDLRSLSDTALIEYFREASLERSRCGFNAVKGNRIADNKMTPAYKNLKSRGPAAMQALLTLTGDPDPSVRADAAIYAYDADPTLCRDVLIRLIGEPGLPGAFAIVWLIDKDPNFRAEIEEMGRSGPDHFLHELDRRYPPKQRD